MMIKRPMKNSKQELEFIRERKNFEERLRTYQIQQEELRQNWINKWNNELMETKKENNRLKHILSYLKHRHERGSRVVAPEGRSEAIEPSRSQNEVICWDDPRDWPEDREIKARERAAIHKFAEVLRDIEAKQTLPTLGDEVVWTGSGVLDK